MAKRVKVKNDNDEEEQNTMSQTTIELKKPDPAIIARAGSNSLQVTHGMKLLANPEGGNSPVPGAHKQDRELWLLFHAPAPASASAAAPGTEPGQLWELPKLVATAPTYKGYLKAAEISKLAEKPKSAYPTHCQCIRWHGVSSDGAGPASGKRVGQAGQEHEDLWIIYSSPSLAGSPGAGTTVHQRSYKLAILKESELKDSGYFEMIQTARQARLVGILERSELAPGLADSIRMLPNARVTVTEFLGWLIVRDMVPFPA